MFDVKKSSKHAPEPKCTIELTAAHTPQKLSAMQILVSTLMQLDYYLQTPLGNAIASQHKVSSNTKTKWKKQAEALAQQLMKIALSLTRKTMTEAEALVKIKKAIQSTAKNITNNTVCKRPMFGKKSRLAGTLNYILNIVKKTKTAKPSYLLPEALLLTPKTEVEAKQYLERHLESMIQKKLLKLVLNTATYDLTNALKKIEQKTLCNDGELLKFYNKWFEEVHEDASNIVKDYILAIKPDTLLPSGPTQTLKS